jgi:hypothetical protein
MDMKTNIAALDVNSYLSMDWRTTVHSDGACSKILTHLEFIALAIELQVKVVSELKSVDSPTASKDAVAAWFIADYATNNFQTNDFPLRIVYPQSMEEAHVSKFLSVSTGRNAVFKYGAGLRNGLDTWSNTYKQILDSLLAQQNPLKYVNVAMNELLIAKDRYGGTFERTAPTQYFQKNNISLWVWTFDAWRAKSKTCLGAGSVDKDWSWFHGQCLSEGQFFEGTCLYDYSESERANECQWVVYKDADELLILHALFEDAKAMAVFSEWSATVSHYVSCVKKRSATAVTFRKNEVAYVTAADAYVGRRRCSAMVTKFIKQTSLLPISASAPCANVTINIKLATNVPLFVSPSCGAVYVSISGLTGSCTGLQDFTQQNGAFNALSFNRVSGALVLNVTTKILAGCEYDTSFSLTHSSKEFAGLTPFVQVTGITIAGSSMDTPSDEGRPMKVEAFSFKMYEIYQSSSLPCDNNTLTVTLQSNTNLCNTRVTITGITTSDGLSPTLTPAGPILTYWTWTSQNQEQTAAVFGKLVSSAGKTFLEVDVPPGPSNSWKLQFTLVNPSSPRICQGVYLAMQIFSCSSGSEVQLWPTASNGGDGRLVVRVERPIENFPSSKIEGNVGVRDNADFCPFYIRTNTILTKNIGQSSSYPCDQNVIAVTLSVSLPMISRPEYAVCTQCITIAGLTGSQTPDGNMVLFRVNNEPALKDTAEWSQANGQLKLKINDGAIFIGYRAYVFNVTLVNQAKSQCSPLVSVKTCLDTVPTQMVRDSVSANLGNYESNAGDAQPMQILRARFMTYKIGQTSPYPGCKNTLIVTVSSNVPMLTKNCNSYIKIFGLNDGSIQRVPGRLLASPAAVPPVSGVLQLSGHMHMASDHWSPGFCSSNETIDSLFWKSQPGDLGSPGYG